MTEKEFTPVFTSALDIANSIASFVDSAEDILDMPLYLSLVPAHVEGNYRLTLECRRTLNSYLTYRLTEQWLNDNDGAHKAYDVIYAQVCKLNPFVKITSSAWY